MNATVPQRAGRREWIGLGVLALACVLYAMDLTVLHLAVPSLSAALQPSSAQLLWIIDIYGFLVAGSLITMGTLGDRIGRRRLLFIGAGTFGLMSILAAFSTSANMLIASRALMGVAGATLAPSTLSLIFNMFRDPGQRSAAIGVWITSFSVGGAVGPLLGGVLLEYFWWGSVFLLALPVMALLLGLGPRVLPEFCDPAAGRLDLPSAAMSLAAVLAVIFGLKQSVQYGFGPLPAAAVAAGLAIGLLFLRRQARLPDPLIEVRLFRAPRFNVSLATNVMAVFIAVGYFLFIAQYFQLVVGLTPLQAGLWSLPSAVGFIAGSNLAPRFVHRIRPSIVLGLSLALAAVALTMLTQVEGGNGLGTVVAASVVISLALSPVFNLTTELIVGSAPPERAGAASGISETGAELGGAMGIAILGSIGTALYRSQVARGLPAGIPSEAARAALDTLGGAVNVAAQLPGPLGEALLELARASFVRGLNLTSGIAAVIALAAAALAAILLRGVPAGEAVEHASGQQAIPAEIEAPSYVGSEQG
jgi:DHA2 family multidrug resistance protein-like MFS transporter